MQKMMYFDHAATTPVDKTVLKAMLPYFSEEFGNASTLYELGKMSREAIEKARANVAKLINADAGEIIFTSGGTESDNMAIRGILSANKNKKHIITSRIEHHAILDTCKWLQKNGYEITYIAVDSSGLVNPKDVENAIRPDTAIVSIMHANNEIGTIEPIEEIGEICRRKGVLFHTDAVQTFGKVSIDVKKMNIDLLSASSHKIYGPKGIGLLYVRKGIKIEPLIFGGGQERNLRSGTENVAGIVGFGAAAEIALKEMKRESAQETKLRDYLIKGIMEKVPRAKLNGHANLRLPNNVNISFEAIEGEGLILLLNEKGVAASTGSACSTGSLEPSHVLLGMGLSHSQAHGSLRLTIGRSTTKKDCDYVLKVLPTIVERLRSMSPFWKG
jgi:cysteine desulfurase